MMWSGVYKDMDILANGYRVLNGDKYSDIFLFSAISILLGFSYAIIRPTRKSVIRFFDLNYHYLSVLTGLGFFLFIDPSWQTVLSLIIIVLSVLNTFFLIEFFLPKLTFKSSLSSVFYATLKLLILLPIFPLIGYALGIVIYYNIMNDEFLLNHLNFIFQYSYAILTVLFFMYAIGDVLESYKNVESKSFKWIGKFQFNKIIILLIILQSLSYYSSYIWEQKLGESFILVKKEWSIK